MGKVAVVIPIYKKLPDWNEEISLRQTMRVLSKHPIVVVCPEKLDISVYESMYAESNSENSHLLRESFDNAYFNGIKGYNRLLLSECFYERFCGYEYILICQPDAYVFRDELTDWCNKEYDFIGAPLFGDFTDKKLQLDRGRVGNGGFSLRRVESYMRFFRGNRHVIRTMNISERINFSKKPSTRWLVWLLMSMGWHNTPKSVANSYQWNEDGFWSGELEGTNYEFSKPSVQEALEFAWERFPGEIHAKIGHLPFGCHAWEKYEYESFWKKYIK